MFVDKRQRHMLQGLFLENCDESQGDLLAGKQQGVIFGNYDEEPLIFYDRTDT